MGIEVVKDEADRGQFDGTALKDKDPSKVYRWSNRREMAVARHEFNGYEVVDSTRDKARSVCNDRTRMKKGADSDTSITLGDMVLMSTSKENHERRMREEAERIRKQTSGVSAEYRRTIARMAGGNQGFEDHKESDAGYRGSYDERDFERDLALAKERQRKG